MNAQTRKQLDRARAYAAKARKHAPTDARAACNEARTATEGLLRVLAETNGIDLQERKDKPATLDTLRQALRQKGLLTQRMDDHAHIVQRLGNRGVHFQADDEAELTPKDASIAVDALEALLPLVLEALGHTPDEGRWGWLAWPLTLASLPVVLWLSFTGGLTLLEATVGDRPAAAPATPTPAPLPRVDDLLAAPPPPSAPAHLKTQAEDLAAGDEAPADPEARAAALVRLRKPLDNRALAPLDCTQLGHVRSWLFASHGYRFSDPSTAAWFQAQRGYRDAGRDASAAVAAFTDDDRANLDALNRRLKDAGCPCPRPLQPRRPCPE